MPLYFYWFRCVVRFWNSLLTTNNTLLSKINQADLLLAEKKGSWTFEVMSALRNIPGADVHISAIMSRSKINMSDFESLLREQIIREWRDLDQIHPHDAHVSSRVMRTYHTHFGVPIGSRTGWWGDQKRAIKPTLPSYLRHDIPNNLSRALSRLRLSGHNLNVEVLRQQQRRVPYELRICTKCNWHCVQDDEHVLLDCPSADLADLRIKHHHLFRTLFSGSSRLRDFINQPDTKGLALFVHECLSCCA